MNNQERIENLKKGIAAAKRRGESSAILEAALNTLLSRQADEVFGEKVKEVQSEYQINPSRLQPDEARIVSGKRENTMFVDSQAFYRYQKLKTRLRDVLRNFSNNGSDPHGTRLVVIDLLDKIHYIVEAACQEHFKDYLYTKPRPIGDRSIGKTYNYTSDVLKTFNL